MQVRSREAAGRRVFVSALVVLVFVLALRAELSLYDPPQAGSVNPAAVSKLWVSGEKLKAAVPPLWPLLWLTALQFFPPPVRRVAGMDFSHRPAPRPLALRELYRFLRPPPAF